MRPDGPYHRPWLVPPNRVSRFYHGGLLLDRFRGSPAPADTNEPEDWVGSATRAWTPPGTPLTDEGLAVVDVGGEPRRVADLLAADPEAVAGRALVAAAGPTTGVLVKLLDAAIRLPVHAHPTRSFARRHLGSFFGKAEAWIVLRTRRVDGEPPPRVRIGFARDIGRDELRTWIETEASGPLLDALGDQPTQPGDAWFVPPGVPHAIGAGVFILEVQEPSDFSIVAETAGFPIDRDDAHLRLGWDVMLDAIDRRALLSAVPGRVPDATAANTLSPLLPRRADPYFRADQLTIAGEAGAVLDDAFSVGVVTAGSGIVEVDRATLQLRPGVTFALPAAAAPDATFRAVHGMTVLVCRGPRAADLEVAA
ncbi:MAG TPA: hypothetical protein VFV72_04265 [Candidatus Limnocylindrales bacterium]|nr:hypothetical protein [Candidatus Limnocylindrales bacterium]